MSVALFTAAYNDAGNQLDLLRQSAAKYGHTLLTFGGPCFKNWVDCKVKDAIAFLKQAPEHNLFMWVDGFDSLITNTPSAARACWQSYDQLNGGAYDTVVVAVEAQCWPDGNLAVQYPDPRGPYINAGGFIGPRIQLIRTLETVLRYCTDENDQLGWHRAFIDGALPDVVLDRYRWLYHCMSDGNPESQPVVMHWNGHTPGREEFWKGMNGLNA